jgi:hypothetical protein
MHCEFAGIGQKFMGKFYPLWSHFHAYDGHACDVTPRPVEMSDQSGLN